jgi:hypothetical protein
MQQNIQGLRVYAFKHQKALTKYRKWIKISNKKVFQQYVSNSLRSNQKYFPYFVIDKVINYISKWVF